MKKSKSILICATLIRLTKTDMKRDVFIPQSKSGSLPTQDIVANGSLLKATYEMEGILNEKPDRETGMRVMEARVALHDFMQGGTDLDKTRRAIETLGCDTLSL